jgi:hypothetical protein
MTTIVTRIQNDVKMVIAFTISKDYPNIFVGSSKYQLSYLNDDWRFCYHLMLIQGGNWCFYFENINLKKDNFSWYLFDKRLNSFWWIQPFDVWTIYSRNKLMLPKDIFYSLHNCICCRSILIQGLSLGWKNGLCRTQFAVNTLSASHITVISPLVYSFVLSLGLSYRVIRLIIIVAILVLMPNILNECL